MMMNLIVLKNYLEDIAKPVSLSDLAKAFKADPALLREMLSHWVRKQKVNLIKPAQTCSQCPQCDPNCREYYAITKSDKNS
jgi:hypothetical protein